MNLYDMSDDAIIKFIAQNLEKIRLSQKITGRELAKKGGFSAQTFSNFLNKNSDIKLSTFIQILKGLKKLELLEKLEYKVTYSPFSNETKLSKRVRSRKIAQKNPIIWGKDK